jgi:hypothetical protein
LIPLWEIGYRQADVIQVIEVRQQVGRLVQRDPYVPRLTVDLLYLLVHRVQTGACKVSLGVRQTLGVVRAGSFANC